MIEPCSPFSAMAKRASIAGGRGEAYPIFSGDGAAVGRLHEIFAARAGDEASAAGYALIMALSVLPPNSPLLWLRIDKEECASGLYGLGLAALGLDPAQIILGRLPDTLAILRAGVDALRCSGLGAVIMEVPGQARELDLTATRRMTLAAETSGVTPILLRSRAKPMPSAAYSRWSVESAPARSFPANAPGYPAFATTLTRRRDGVAGVSWDMEWDRDTTSLRPLTPNAQDSIAPVSGAAFPLAVGRSLAAGANGAGRARRA